MSLLVLLAVFLKHFISQVVILRSRGLVVVQIWPWYVSVGTKMKFIGPANRNCHTKLLDAREVTQLTFLGQERVKSDTIQTWCCS